MPLKARGFKSFFMFSESIFRANDIRGLWNKDFDLSFTKDLAYGLAYLCRHKAKVKKPRFLVGHDARKSSPSLAKALVKELKKQGIDVGFVALAPSPLCYFLMQHYRLTGCVVVTASHNPPRFNGFKIVFHKKHPLPQVISDLKKTLKARPKKARVYSPAGKSLSLDKEKPYLDSLKKEFSKVQSSKIRRILLDTGNGALGPIAHKAFKALGIKAKILFKKPDGNFPNHHPDPSLPKNLKALKKELKSRAYSLALAFDGDGDRLVLLDSTGKSFKGDELAFLLLKSLKKPKQALILADVKCGDWFFKKAREEGFRVKMIASGHGLVRAEMEKTRADLALEFSGHIFFNDKKNRGFDDALYAGLRLIAYLQSQNKTQNELPSVELSPKKLLPPRWLVETGEIRMAKNPQDIALALLKVKKYLKSKKERFKSIDGIRFSRKNSWGLLRASQTQPVFSMRFSAESLKQLKALKKEFSQVIGFKIP